MKQYISIAAILAAAMFGALALSPARPASAGNSHSIAGFVYEDLNNNGIKEPGEPGIAGVTITLSGDDSQTTTTDANGAYLFLPESCCVYTVTETQPAGYADGIDTVGVGGCGLGTLGNDVFTDICIEGDTATGYNFGELPLTEPSATATAQQRLKTHTPTATPTATVTNTATPTPPPATSTPPQPSPEGNAGGRVRAPDTGTGGSSGRDTSTIGTVFAALALLVAGSIVAGRGVWQRARRQL